MMNHRFLHVVKKPLCAAGLFFLGALAWYVRRTLHLPALYYPSLAIVAAMVSFIVIFVGRIQVVHGIIQALSGSRNLPKFLFWAAALAYLVVFTYLSICRHEAFTTRMYDFGNMDQAIWNASQGQGLENTSQLFPYDNKSRLANHVEPVYFVLALIYRAIPSPWMLFFIQTLCVVAGMIFIYFIAFHRLGGAWKALATAIVYALYPTVQHMNLFEFHADVLAAPALMGAFLAYEKERRVFFWMCITAALACKEYAGLAAGGMGLGLLLFKKNMRLGIPLMVVGFGYFLFCVMAINPYFNRGHQSDIMGIVYPGIGGQAGFGGIIRHVFSNPLELGGIVLNGANAEGIFYLLFPLAFIPLAVPLFVCGIVPVIAKDLAVGVDAGLHRLACSLPLLFVAFVYGMQKIETSLGKRGSRTSVSTVLIFVLSCSLLATWAYGPSPLGHRFWKERYKYVKSPRTILYHEFLARIPDGVAVSVDDCFAPHLTHRRYCYIFPRPFSPRSEAAERVRMVLIDTLARDVSRCDCNPLALLAGNGFVRSYESGGIFLFTRSAAQGKDERPPASLIDSLRRP